MVAAAAAAAFCCAGGTGTAVAQEPPRLAEERCRSYAPTPSSELINAWQLQRLGMDDAWRLATGDGVTIAVIDTGVSTLGSPYFEPGRVVVKDLIPVAENTSDDGTFDCTHGTIVTSLLAAGNSDDGNALSGATNFTGIAPDAKVIAYRALKASTAEEGESGEENLQYTIDAVRAAIRDDVDIINLSQVTFSDPLLKEFQASIAEAIDAGIVVVAAAGNQTQSGGTQQRPYPAAFPGVIGVGISNREDAGDLATMVSHYITVGAPGRDLVALLPSQDREAAIENQAYLTDATGTSYAAPIVSGVVALMLEYERTTRGDGSAEVTLSPAEVKERLIDTADRMNVPGNDPYIGGGIVNPMRAITNTTSEQVAAPSAEPTLEAQMPDNEPERIPPGSLVALGIGIGTVVIVLLGLVAAIAIPAARRRPGHPQQPEA